MPIMVTDRVRSLLIDTITNPMNKVSQFPNGCLNKVRGITCKTCTPKVLPICLYVVGMRWHTGMRKPLVHTFLRINIGRIVQLRGSKCGVYLFDSGGFTRFIPNSMKGNTGVSNSFVVGWGFLNTPNNASTFKESSNGGGHMGSNESSKVKSGNTSGRGEIIAVNNIINLFGQKGLRLSLNLKKLEASKMEWSVQNLLLFRVALTSGPNIGKKFSTEFLLNTNREVEDNSSAPKFR